MFDSGWGGGGCLFYLENIFFFLRKKVKCCGLGRMLWPSTPCSLPREAGSSLLRPGPSRQRAEPLGGRRRPVPGAVPRKELLALLALGQALGEPVSLALVCPAYGACRGKWRPCSPLGIPILYHLC